MSSEQILQSIQADVRELRTTVDRLREEMAESRGERRQGAKTAGVIASGVAVVVSGLVSWLGGRT